MQSSNPLKMLAEKLNVNSGSPASQDETGPSSELVGSVKRALQDLELDVSVRNTYINTRDRALYGSGLWQGLDVPVGSAEYNFCTRVVDIHAAQLMGRGFNVYSYYNKEDIDAAIDPTEKEMLKSKNRLKKSNSDARKRVVDAIIKDNGGFDIFKRGARSGSGYGNTVYKSWFDKDSKQYKIVLLESIQNYRRGWSGDNFRESDYDAFVHQISLSQAYRLYGDKLPKDVEFETSKEGHPFMDATFAPMNTLTGSTYPTDGQPNQTARPMVAVMEFTGYLPGWSVDGDKVVPTSDRKGKPFNLLIVGGHVVQTITDEDYLPKYWFVPNRVVLRRPWGQSDLPQSALDINREIIMLYADQITWANKNLFKLIQAKGFAPNNIPKKKPRVSQVVAMSPEQSLEEMTGSNQSLQEWTRLIEQRMDAFVRVTGIGRVMFDDPSISANSNQALMTTLKGVIDIVEDKQSRWEPVLREMFTHALKVSAKFIPELKPIIEEDTDWDLCIEWPSVLRREDATYRTMWLNEFNRGSISWETYLEKIGVSDTGEEMDRVKDEMQDKVSAAVMSNSLALLLQNLLMPQPMLPGAAPTTQPDPTMTADNNTGAAPTSQPGSGATTVSPEGAIAQASQQGGA